METRAVIERRELLADLAVHVVGLVLGAAGALAMLLAAARSSQRGELVPIAVYLAGLLAMLSCSALYNIWLSCRRRDWLRRLDHAAIFVMIAGTYTPLTLRLPESWALGLTAGVWLAAAVGVAIKPLLASLERPTLVLLLAGGVVYSGGVVFHLGVHRRYARALWHGSVLVAAVLHYVAIASLLEV